MKFMELYDRWTEVYHDLESVGQQEVLNHNPTIKDFIKLLPGDAIVERYLATKKELSARGDSPLAIVQAFMKSERTKQMQKMELMGTRVASSKESTEKGLCFKCNQSGHRQANCPNKSTGGIKQNHGT